MSITIGYLGMLKRPMASAIRLFERVIDEEEVEVATNNPSGDVGHKHNKVPVFTRLVLGNSTRSLAVNKPQSEEKLSVV